MVNYFNEQSQIKLITLKENIKTLLQIFFLKNKGSHNQTHTTKFIIINI